MKVKHYNEMMAYLTRPGFNGGGTVSNRTVLPKRKPAEEVKKRKKINYEKLKQYLGEESRELIERELGFAIGGGVNPSQLKQRFMQLVASIQDADEAEIPSIVAQAKQIKDQIDELNQELAPDRQIKLTAEGLQFDNPLVDAANIQKSVEPIQPVKKAIASITKDNPALAAVPNFERGTKGTLADPEEKQDPTKKMAATPKGNVVQAAMKMNRQNVNKTIRDYMKTRDLYEAPEVYPEIKTEDAFADGGRIGFSKGGSAKVFEHLDSLPEGTEIDLNYVRNFVEENNIDANAENVYNQFAEVDYKRTNADGKKVFKYAEKKRNLLKRIKNKLNFKKLTEVVSATTENLEKLDNLINNTNLTLEQIGKELGYKNPKSFKFAPTKRSVLAKAYIEKYGEPPEGRFKYSKLTEETPKVKQAIELKDRGLSTRQVARELGVQQSEVVNYFRLGGREDLIGEVPPKKEGTPLDRTKKARMENIKEGEKYASKSDKAFNKAEDLRVQKINAFLKSNSDQLVNNQKFIDLVNLKLDGKGNIISKNKSPEEIAKLLKDDRLFERDHISSVAKRKRNMQFPVNFQMAPKNINQGFFGAVEAYVNRPDADPEKIKKISNVLDQYGLRVSTNKGTIGAKQIPASQVIDRNLKALGLSTEIGKSRPIIIGSNFANVTPDLFDFRKLPDDVKNVSDVIRNLIKTPAGKRIARNLIKAGKFTGYGLAGEVAFAAPFALDDYASGLTGDRILGNATLGLFGETEQEEIKKATGELGYATQTIEELGSVIPEIEKKYKSYNDENDPRGEKRQQFLNLYNSTIDRYNKAYNLFVTDEGNFDKELYNQGVTNYAAGLGQIEKFRAAKEKERGIKGEVTGFEIADPYNPNNIQLDLSFLGGNPLEPKRIDKAGGGIAKEGGVESGVAPESGPTPDGPKGLFSAIKYVKKS